MLKPIKIIGISPGTRYMGFAIFYGSDLRDWGIKNIAGKRPEDRRNKALSVISGLIGHHRTNVLSIKELHPSRSSLNLDRLVSEIKAVSKRNGLRIYQYSINDMESFFCPDERANKKGMIESVVSRYPTLFHELNKEQANINPYYVRMFEAVGLGSICFSHLDRHI